MIRSKFLNARQRNELEQIVRRSSEDHGGARRANAILLLDDGKSCARIAEFLYLDDDTIRTWHKHYMSGGWDELEMFDWKGGMPHLDVAQSKQLCTWLEGRLCRATKEFMAYIETGFDVHYSHCGSIKLLHRLGFEYKNPKPCRVWLMRVRSRFSLIHMKIYCTGYPMMRRFTLPMRFIRNIRCARLMAR